MNGTFKFGRLEEDFIKGDGKGMGVGGVEL